ncbi:ABC transporter permease subunit/CPBP intramembrane protease [Tautonia sociabilis]|uniref:CPBP family intramembrane metalloprotease n=1 Tax=Tautonia sociabilis TaxID=2080755 RepID=A0A432MJ02_9BACT|nr:ABC transporter permease subunit/CPBP intramembrane protease [Tautonia sociabilis]RUL87210.1 CPBP family intramembrane metalloprotease [Tautonia sociabilis]
MRWSRIRLIFGRELRDQLRDRRTIFMIFVLPVLLYPILGFTVKTLAEAFDNTVRRVVVVGAEYLPDEPPLLTEGEGGFLRFDPGLFDGGGSPPLLIEPVPPGGRWDDPQQQLAALRNGEADVIVDIPAEVRGQITRLERPTFKIAYLRSDEQSLATYQVVEDVIARWQDAIVARRLAADEKPAEYVAPVEVEAVDLARQVLGSSASGVSVWARLFPFLLVMMALTGAFYPAVDLCAGEKERGTMETLLISPALRSEIVVGKFLTVMAASAGTALLNLASMGLTMAVLGPQLAAGAAGPGSPMDELAPPSPIALAWIVVLLIPLSGFFSAVCLALAVLARSMKEGQYYMTPLYLISLPLIFLTLMPGVDLNPFYSLVPITGVSLLLKKLILEQYVEARPYFLPVLLSTIVYGLIALRWAVGQFRTEQVLFREAERFDLGSWVRHLVRDRGPVPSGGQAVACFAIILALSWYTSILLTRTDPLVALALGQLVFILVPPTAMALVLTSSPRRTLRLRWPGWAPILLATGLAATLNPLTAELRPVVTDLFPIPPAVEQALEALQAAIPNLATAVLLIAVIPAICEEVAFRGYILSGLETAHSRGVAIVLSAFLFAFLHVLISLFQQFFNAALLGLVLGWMALKTRSLFPSIAFHLTNNALAVLGPSLSVGWLYRDQTLFLYRWPIVAFGAVASIGLLAVLDRIGQTKADDPVAADLPADQLAGASAAGPE